MLVMKSLFRFLPLVYLSLLIGLSDLHGQSCDTITPSFTVNLTNDPNGTYISPQVVRDGNCCGTSGNVKCIEFIVSLHPDAEGVIFDIFSGAVPGGALFYQINCSAPSALGSPICLSGPGPHVITFCKPGNNVNEYRITSVAEPTLPDEVYVNDGCTQEIGTQGFDESTITWNTIFPGITGQYNSYLSCTTACDTTTVTPQPGYPDSIQIEVCGFPFGGCDTVYTCETVTVYFFSTLRANILPLQPTICFGDTSVSISANGSGGSPPYNYTWSTGDSTQFLNVNTGTYWVEIGDTSGCPPAYDTVVVTEFSLPIEANAGGNNYACVENFPVPLTGTIQAAAGGIWVGNGAFSPSDTILNTSYQPDSTEIAQGFADILLVTTGNGTCPADTDMVRIDLLQFNATISTAAKPVSCKGNSDGEAYVGANGVRIPYTFQWGAGTGNQTGDSALNLPAGVYNVTATDSAGCILDTTVEVIEADSVLAVQFQTMGETCFGDMNGWAKIFVTGGATPYTLVWDSAITNVSGDTLASNLGQGTYSVQITDAYGCVIDTVFVIDGPIAPLTAALTKVNIGCKNGNDGTATAIPSGGTSPYTYQWNDSSLQGTQTATGLGAGLYTVVVTDTNGCLFSDTISLNEPPSSITFTDSTTSPSCFGFTDGTATVFPSGGTPAYSFQWDSAAGNQTTQTATGLSAGTYSCIIFDQNSCLLATPVIVVDPAPLFATAVEIVHVTCKGGAYGSAKVIPTGGTGPYTYQWDANAGNQTDSIADSLSAGTYAVFVYDQNGCSYIPGITIDEPDDSLTIIMGSIPVTCKGGSDGIAWGLINGGTLPYTITWSASAGSQTTDTAFNLSAGTYPMSVSDSNNCTADSLVTVTEPAQLLIPNLGQDSALCFGDSSGKAYVAPTGGVQPYYITWDTNALVQSTDTAYNLPAGTYSVIIRDDNNCVIDTSITVLQPFPLLLAGAQRDVACYGEQTGWAWVIANGGTGPYSYQWDANTGGQVGDSAKSLGVGSYFVTATDINGCSVDSQYVITEPDTFVYLSPYSDSISCFGDSNGVAAIIANGGTPPYTYLWAPNANAQTTDTAFNLKAGTYQVTVTDSLGCSDNYPVVVGGPQNALSALVTKTDLSCFQSGDGETFVVVSGGTAPYTYNWMQGLNTQSNDTGTGWSAGYVYITVEDSRGCVTEEDSILLAEPPDVFLTVSNSDTICIGDSLFVNMTASGGNGGPFTYRRLPNTAVTPPLYLSPSQTTIYGFRGIDQNGCPSNTQILTVFVQNLLQDTIEVTSSGDICLGDTVEINGYHNGIYPGYSYSWNAGQTALSFKTTPNQSRYYTLTVEDDCAITVKDSVFVEVFPLPALDLDPIIAEGCVPLEVNFRNLATDPDITSYEWDFGDGTTSIDPTPTYTFIDSGEYRISLKLENRFGCTSSNDSANFVYVYPIPNVGFNSNPAFTDIRNPTFEFISTSSKGSHTWTFDGGDMSNDTNPVYTFADTGEYSVHLRVVDSNGCADEITKSVFVGPYFNIEIPNAFTPGSGGNGGRWDPNSTNNRVFFPVTEGVSNYEMLIFNRWGELIFESNNFFIGWDGTVRGQAAPQEVYVWKIKITWENGQNFEGVGDVTLFR